MNNKKYANKKRSNFNTRGRRDQFDKDKSEVAKESANDPSWYTVSGQLVKDVSSLSFNNPLGAPVTLRSTSWGTCTQTIPGVMTIHTAPTIGHSISGSSAINIAAKNLYSWVRHANSGHANYDSPDLMMYLIAMDSLYSWYAFCTRIYGMSVVYSQNNRYVGGNYLTAQGVNAQDMSRNLARFRSWLNQFALKLSAFSIPNTMSLYKRHTWMYANAFKDENDGKAQVYMYMPSILYKYNQTNGSLDPFEATCMFEDGMLKPKTSLLAETLMYMGDSLLNSLITSEDINIMSGDILKAYGTENVWKLSTIPEDYSIVPIYSDEVLYQIHNTRFAGKYPISGLDGSPSLNTFAITQDKNVGDGAILQDLYFEWGITNEYDAYLDFSKNDVTPEDVLVATRNMVFGTVVKESNKYKCNITTMGCDICLFATVWTLLNTNSGYSMTTRNLWASDRHNDSEGASGGTFESKMYFNLAPYTYIADYTVDTLARVAGEMTNYTTVTPDVVSKMHDTALLSMFAVPLIGNIVK